MRKLNRRQMLISSGGLLGLTLSQVTVPGLNSFTGRESFKILVAGGHPDDPESGCGGTICRFTRSGYEVTALYLTKGEAGIEGKTHEEAAKIRTGEAEEACKIMKAHPLFPGQVNGSTKINNEEFDKIAQLIENEAPHMVFTHWPIDTHKDHRATSNLVYHAWNLFRWDDNRAFDLYYYEVLTGEQTQNFTPTHYIDISETSEQKKEATFKHVSQNPSGWYTHHEKMEEFRGLESGHNRAEAFVRQGYGKIF